MIKSLSAFLMEGFQSAFTFCPLDFSGLQLPSSLGHNRFFACGLEMYAGGWVLKSVFIIEYKTVAAVMQMNSQVGDSKDSEHETSHLSHRIY